MGNGNVRRDAEVSQSRTEDPKRAEPCWQLEEKEKEIGKERNKYMEKAAGGGRYPSIHQTLLVTRKGEMVFRRHHRQTEIGNQGSRRIKRR